MDRQAAAPTTQDRSVPPAAIVDFLYGLTPRTGISNAQEKNETKAQYEVR